MAKNITRKIDNQDITDIELKKIVNFSLDGVNQKSKIAKRHLVKKKNLKKTVVVLRSVKSETGKSPSGLA